MLEFRHPMPVITPLGEGYAIYVKYNGPFENDEFTVALKDDGQLRHFTSAQIKMIMNATYGINYKNNKTI